MDSVQALHSAVCAGAPEIAMAAGKNRECFEHRIEIHMDKRQGNAYGAFR